MQLDTQRKQERNAAGRMVVSFDVLCDGVVVANRPTQQGAWDYQTALWEKRPESDRVAEYLYNLSHP